MTNFEAGEWPVSYLGIGCSSFDDSGIEELQEQFENIAANLLWNFTGRIFGTVTQTIRPCRVITPFRPSTFEGMGPASAYYELGGVNGWGWLPVYVNGSWSNIRCGRCSSVACSCSPDEARAIHLPGPVQAIDEIKIDGAVLAPTAYRVDNGHTLIRQDGEAWPTAQDLIEPLDQPNTWSIEFSRGVAVPTGGKVAAGILACELYKAAVADPSCSLPSRVKTVARQGVTVGIMDTFEGLDEGKTGLWAVDSWIASVQRPRDYVGVASPDTMRRPGWKL